MALAQALDVASNPDKPWRNQLPKGAKAVIGHLTLRDV